MSRLLASFVLAVSGVGCTTIESQKRDLAIEYMRTQIEFEKEARAAVISQAPDCDLRNPANFTFVYLAENSPTGSFNTIPIYGPIEGCRSADSAAARAYVSERGDILIHFDPRELLEQLPGPGWLSVKASLLSDGSPTAQPIEVLNYESVGQDATPQQAFSTAGDAAALALFKSACRTDRSTIRNFIGTLDRHLGVDVVPDEVSDDAICNPDSGASKELLKRARAEKPIGWSDVRIVPKNVGAREGDVVKVTVEHRLTKPVGNNSPRQEGDRAWELSFVVERSGFYVTTSPRLALAWTSGYSPLSSLRGAQGALIPGVGVDFRYFPARRMPGWFAQTFFFVFSGLGIAVDYLDFDTRQAIELGLSVNAQLFRGIMTVGIGYDMGIQEPRFSDRGLYWSIGLGVDKILDQAKPVADFFKR